MLSVNQTWMYQRIKKKLDHHTLPSDEACPKKVGTNSDYGTSSCQTHCWSLLHRLLERHNPGHNLVCNITALLLCLWRAWIQTLRLTRHVIPLGSSHHTPSECTCFRQTLINRLATIVSNANLPQLTLHIALLRSLPHTPSECRSLIHNSFCHLMTFLPHDFFSKIWILPYKSVQPQKIEIANNLVVHRSEQGTRFYTLSILRTHRKKFRRGKGTWFRILKIVQFHGTQSREGEDMWLYALSNLYIHDKIQWQQILHTQLLPWAQVGTHLYATRLHWHQSRTNTFKYLWTLEIRAWMAVKAPLKSTVWFKSKESQQESTHRPVRDWKNSSPTQRKR